MVQRYFCLCFFLILMSCSTLKKVTTTNALKYEKHHITGNLKQIDSLLNYKVEFNKNVVLINDKQFFTKKSISSNNLKIYYFSDGNKLLVQKIKSNDYLILFYEKSTVIKIKNF